MSYFDWSGATVRKTPRGGWLVLGTKEYMCERMAIYFCFFFRSRFWIFLEGFLVPCFLLLCFSAFCFSCFSACLLLCFSAFLLFAFPAFCFSCFSALPASFLFCFSAFPASLFFCFCALPIVLCSFLQSCALLLYFLLLCFSASCLYYLFVFFSFLCLLCILNKTLKTQGETKKNLKEILIRTPDKKPLHETLNEP